VRVDKVINGNVVMPDPKEILGGLDLPESEWPEYQDGVRPKYMRETVAHQELLFHFTKVMVMADLFRNCADKKPLSKYMTTTLEACLVLLYHNNYACWYGECHARAPPGRAEGAGRKFTNNARGSGKNKGWASAGMTLYRKIVEVLGQQRKEEENPTLVEFDGKLLTRFKTEYGKPEQEEPEARDVHNLDDETDDED
jgi:hypothetical protein